MTSPSFMKFTGLLTAIVRSRFRRSRILIQLVRKPRKNIAEHARIASAESLFPSVQARSTQMRHSSAHKGEMGFQSIGWFAGFVSVGIAMAYRHKSVAQNVAFHGILNGR